MFRKKLSDRAVFVFLLIGLILPLLVRAEEGMWLPDHPPSAALRHSYGFAADRAWLTHVQRSCVRMEASGALVSSQGLLLTNHHVGIEQMQRLSTPGRDLLRDGFYASTPADELPCTGMEVQVLDSIVDVTDQVLSAAPAGMDPAEAHQARQGRMTRIEAEARDRTGLDGEIVTLDQGARYHLYLYKRYDDIRLVFAPEEAVANFGGDLDNFEYPRYAYDLCFFRVYEDGRPLAPTDWLRWSAQGVRAGELLFAFGHPYRTGRQMSVDQLRFQRDYEIPWHLQAAWRREVKLLSFSARSFENARVSQNDLLDVQNWRKSETGALAGLQDPAIFQAAVAREESLRAWVRRDPGRQARWGRGWDLMRAAHEAHVRLFPRLRFFLRLKSVFDSELFNQALTLVELARELPMPSEERSRRYRDSELESVYLELFAPTPIWDALEIEKMESGLSFLAESFGAEDSLVAAALEGLSPRERARRLVRGCTLRDPEVRRRLAKDGRAALDASDDPMIRLAARLDPVARALRRENERAVEGPEEEGQTLLATARMERDGKEAWPDATGTLRLSFGTVKGYEEEGGPVPTFTTFRGLYARWEENQGREPFDLPERWVAARDRLDPDTPLNFLSTLDTVGGSSGSPVVNARGEIVGLVFDGNLESLVWDYAWEDLRARCIAVDARAILEGLRRVYGAERLASELTR